MRMVDIIAKKRHGGHLSKEEIAFFVEGYAVGNIPDYQAAALLMAVCFAGMDSAETADLTMAMASSGDMIDLSSIPGVKVDKHSTGGVGDKTTLIVGPIVASCGVPVAKMSGRGLGHTGGTIDKLESIPGFLTDISRDRFLKLVKEHAIAVAGQTGNLAPADKKLYALRDVTATVDSIPLIAASVMSKKIAAGADAIVLDVKCGSGAFCKTVGEAQTLAHEMVRIGMLAGRKTVALITDMDIPLGHMIGNSLEVIEAIQTLRGNGPADLTAVCQELAANMLLLAGKGNLADCRSLAGAQLRNGLALAKFRELVCCQGGDGAYVDTPEEHFTPAALRYEVAAPCGGFLTHMDCEGIGVASMQLGAGRRKKDDAIDPAAGIALLCKTGDAVQPGQPVAVLHTADKCLRAEAQETLLAALEFGEHKPQNRQSILSRIVQ